MLKGRARRGVEGSAQRASVLVAGGGGGGGGGEEAAEVGGGSGPQGPCESCTSPADPKRRRTPD